jgi:hypothetical protein
MFLKKCAHSLQKRSGMMHQMNLAEACNMLLLLGRERWYVYEEYALVPPHATRYILLMETSVGTGLFYLRLSGSLKIFHAIQGGRKFLF